MSILCPGFYTVLDIMDDFYSKVECPELCRRKGQKPKSYSYHPLRQCPVCKDTGIIEDNIAPIYETFNEKVSLFSHPITKLWNGNGTPKDKD